MVKPHSKRSGQDIEKQVRPNLKSLKPREKPRTLVRDYDDAIDQLLNYILDDDLEIVEENKGCDEWLNDVATESSMADEMIGLIHYFICADHPDVDHDCLKMESNGYDIPIQCSMIDDRIWVDPDVLTNGSDGCCSDVYEFLNGNNRSVTSPEFEIWSPTPDYSGFDEAEYWLNILPPFEEDETNINPSLPNRDEQPD